MVRLQSGWHAYHICPKCHLLAKDNFFYLDCVIEFKVKSLIFNTYKCCRHIQHSRVITPWSHFVQYQPKVRSEALTSWSLSLSLDPPVLRRSLWLLWFGFSFTALRAMLLSLLHFPILPLELTLLWGDASLFFFSVCKNQRANSKVKSTLGDKDPMTSNCSTTETYHQSLKVTLIVWQLSKTCVHIRQASKLCRCCPLYPIQQITYDFTLKRHPRALALRNYSPAGRIICGGCGTLRSKV